MVRVNGLSGKQSTRSPHYGRAKVGSTWRKTTCLHTQSYVRTPHPIKVPHPTPSKLTLAAIRRSLQNPSRLSIEDPSTSSSYQTGSPPVPIAPQSYVTQQQIAPTTLPPTSNPVNPYRESRPSSPPLAAPYDRPHEANPFSSLLARRALQPPLSTCRSRLDLLKPQLSLIPSPKLPNLPTICNPQSS
ncbi:hypothetical protein KFK09_009738 [Dendrobium nobile]|uniref:Uncharacterized protein n=1 Tax=Dendrobium nobile TaxID=94219 RepID=A0A8T3BKK6_DENNO|nr:hypothetical protein KFK09_009738 [Dendrobium nobile]